MIDLNKVLIVGRLTKDPMAKGSGDKAVAHLSIAYNPPPRKRDEKPESSFFDVTVFGRQAEFAEKYLRLGSAVIVEGRLKQERWEDKEGNKRQRVVIVADRLGFAESKSEASSNRSDDKPERQPARAETNNDAQAATDDDLPF